MASTPISAYETTRGMVYFPRMLNKIRLHAAGDLREDFQENLGRGYDRRCVDFLRVDYEALRARVLEGGNDEEVLDWCFQNGRELSEGDIFLWNQAMTRMGWRNDAKKVLDRRKGENGLGDRDDIETMFDFFEVDEGRKP